jgi:molecular chaperone GrpE
VSSDTPDDIPSEEPESNDPESNDGDSNSPNSELFDELEAQFDDVDTEAVEAEVLSDQATGGPASDLSVEDLVAGLEAVTVERDGYLDSLRRLQAEFENYRKAVAKREVETRERANEGLVREILPVLDACDGAVANGAVDVAPIHKALLDSLTKQGLERLEPADQPFDPDRDEAVMHEPAEDGDDQGPVVAEVLRAGYGWKGRIVRPVMVKVRG